MNGKNFFLKLMCAALFFVALSASQTFAQPTDAQIKKHLSGPKVVSSTLHKPGKKVWSSTYSKYVWDIGFTNKIKDVANPGGFIYVGLHYKSETEICSQKICRLTPENSSADRTSLF